MTYIFIGIAGAIGASLRYGLSLTIEFSGNGFPFATFITNILGSFILGWFTTRIKQKNALPPRLITAISTGLIGSFTTFSTFNTENIELIKQKTITVSIAYLGLSYIVGILLAFLGIFIGMP